MDLRAYMASIPVKDRPAFAARCGTTAGHLQNVAYGYKPCGEGLAISIERESKGSVTVEELRPDVDWAYIRGTKRKRA
jgi:DNA-binding transcriptional regulator YdaS (Cro superfamily)